MTMAGTNDGVTLTSEFRGTALELLKHFGFRVGDEIERFQDGDRYRRAYHRGRSMGGGPVDPPERARIVGLVAFACWQASVPLDPAGYYGVDEDGRYLKYPDNPRATNAVVMCEVAGVARPTSISLNVSDWRKVTA